MDCCWQCNTINDDLRNGLMQHFALGQCVLQQFDYNACASITDGIAKNSVNNSSSCSDFHLDLLSNVCGYICKWPLHETLHLLHIAFPAHATLCQLCALLKTFIRRQIKGKCTSANHFRHQQSNPELPSGPAKPNFGNVWPQTLSVAMKDKLVSAFCKETLLAALSQFTCACCAESCPSHDQNKILASDLPLSLLHTLSENSTAVTSFIASSLSGDDLADYYLDTARIFQNRKDETVLVLCHQCHSSLRQHKIPMLALANNLALGDIPDELKELTVIKEAMIAHCRSKCWIVQLKESNQDLPSANTQQGMKGHIIIYPQRPGELYSVLPPLMSDLITPICVIFIGANPPSEAWLRDKVKPLAIHREKVCGTLLWLKQHNPLYADIEIDHTMLNGLMLQYQGDTPERLLFHLCVRLHKQHWLRQKWRNTQPSLRCTNGTSLEYWSTIPCYHTAYTDRALDAKHKQVKRRKLPGHWHNLTWPLWHQS